jgi:hypothetical protein
MYWTHTPPESEEFRDFVNKNCHDDQEFIHERDEKDIKLSHIFEACSSRSICFEEYIITLLRHAKNHPEHYLTVSQLNVFFDGNGMIGLASQGTMVGDLICYFARSIGTAIVRIGVSLPY